MFMDTLVFAFDYVDPVSYRLERALRVRAGLGGLPPVQRIPLELRPPPEPLLDPAAAAWADRWTRLAEELREEGVALIRPPLVPWSRKAHELRLFAAEKGVEDQVHQALFDGFFLEGLDLGRVDLLVRVGMDAGLEFSETRAVMDVDRFTEEVETAHQEIATLGFALSPGLIWGQHRLDGDATLEDLAAFLDTAAAAV